ncbi:MAG: hypothetical protein LBS74_04465 [Oscillospiraceae bacterium]|jgi:uncharacterized repeat protein (TIGR02543 family)|nr:hypothetical protein [Oscillospiraceae bacterium]
MKKNIIYKVLSLALSFTLVLLGVSSFSAMPSQAAATYARSWTNPITGDVFLGGRYLEIGISRHGSYGTEDIPLVAGWHPVSTEWPGIGFSIDMDGFDEGVPQISGDCFLPGTPEERFILSYTPNNTKDNENIADRMGGASGSSGGGSDDAYSYTYKWMHPLEEPHTVDMSELEKGLLKAVTTGITKDNIRLTQTTSFKEEDKYWRVDVKIENLSAQTVKDVRYTRSFDPDQDLDLSGTYYTFNKVIANPSPQSSAKKQVAMVGARGAATLSPILLYAYDTRARASSPGHFSIFDGYYGMYGSDGSGGYGSGSGSESNGEPYDPEYDSGGLWPEITPGLAVWYTKSALSLTWEDIRSQMDWDAIINGESWDPEKRFVDGWEYNDIAIALSFKLGNLNSGSNTSFHYFYNLNMDMAESLDQSEQESFGNDHTLTVVNGSGGGVYPAGERVEISADKAPEGKAFKGWTTSNGGKFEDKSAADTIFTMPDNDVTITAIFESLDIDIPTGSGSPLPYIIALIVCGLGIGFLLVIMQRKKMANHH